MSLHPAEDVVEDAHGVGEMRALVEHHALGPLAHRGVGDLGARRRAGLGEVLEDLGGPDDGNVPGLAHPQDLLLDLRQAFVTAFHGQVPPGDHDADRGAAHRREEQARQPVEPGPSLDLENDADVLGPEPTEFRLQGAHVLGLVHERETDHVCMAHDHGEVLDVLRREPREGQRAVRQVDPFVGPQLASAGGHVGDLHPKALGIVRLHDPADLAVIEPDTLPGPHVREDLWQGTGDRRRPEQRAIVRMARRSSRSRIASDDERVTGLEHQEGRIGRQFADPRLDRGPRVGGRLVAQLELLPGVQIDRLLGPCPPASFERSVNRQPARLAAKVPEDQAVTIDEALTPASRNVQHRVGRPRRRLRTLAPRQPDTCPADDLASDVAPRAPLEHLRLGRERPRTELGSGKVHEDTALPSERGACRSQMGNHRRPGLWTVVGAVDAHAVHATGQQLADHRRVRRRLARHRHQDANRPLRGLRAEQCGRMLVEQGLPGCEIDAVGSRTGLAPAPADQVMQDPQNGRQIVEHVRLGPSERGQTQRGEALLHLPYIVLPKRDVVKEIPRTASIGRVLIPQIGFESVLHLMAAAAEGQELIDELGQHMGVPRPRGG